MLPVAACARIFSHLFLFWWSRPLMIGRLGLSTCYDMRFPEQYAELVQRGAQILLMPSAFTVPTGQAHWHVLLRGTFIHNRIIPFLGASMSCWQMSSHDELLFVPKQQGQLNAVEICYTIVKYINFE